MVEGSAEDYSTSVKKTANNGMVKDHFRPRYTRHFMLRTIFSISFPLFLLSWPSSQAISWLSVAQMSSVANFDRDTCSSLKTLTRKQMRVCRQNVEHMENVHAGAKLAIYECQYQFRNRPWNCTVLPGDTIFGKVLLLGTRESAFVHAISAAGVAYSVTKACSSGKYSKCGCDNNYRGMSHSGGFQWAGCSDNIPYGLAFSRRFVDAGEKRKKQQSQARLQMNLHNNEAGRKSIENNIRLQCKCHGVSGSCELRTCWRTIPPFREISQILKEKFDGATETKLAAPQGAYGPGSNSPRKGLVPVNLSFKPHTAEDLVYLTPSPSYCTYDNETETHGTHGRVCNRTSKAIDGCELLCCGRGYVTKMEKRIERCQCKFHWCCYVKCKECEIMEEVSTCL